MKITMYFDQDGSGRCFYHEAFPLTALGELTIKRATRVEFNPESQCWEVLNDHDEVQFEHRSRQACLDWERRYFNR